MSNPLANQSSPYLLQHADNPVAWQPWGAAAFEQARRDDKPIFLSVGYSTCHWCHVMAHESFEDEQVAQVLNEHFVPIKVDREELPDVDSQYMLATQAFFMLQQQPRAGGWPNSVWLMPDGRPFYAGTYFPKPMFIHLLTQLNEFWQNQREKVEQNAEAITHLMQRMSRVEADNGAAGELKIDQAIAAILSRFDAEHGGFGGRPKFPPHATLGLLDALHQRAGDERARHMMAATLDAMRRGGVHDHVGGGFHRYATDERWFLPHFEKMLYDNAQLLDAYAAGYAMSGDEAYRRTAARAFEWLHREMTDEAGGFYSAIDADSEGAEGKFYIWTAEQIEHALDGPTAALFIDAYGVQHDGNWTDEASGERQRSNVLYLPRPLRETARAHDMDEPTLLARLDAARQKLLAVRDRRARPHLDDKVLAAWNGLMIAGLARAGEVFDEPAYLDAARRAADFAIKTLADDHGDLRRVYRARRVSQPGYLDDYAYLADGLIALHRATGEQRYAHAARRVAERMIDRFADTERGGFYYTHDGHDAMLFRSKNPQGGGNLPHANAIAAHALLKLSRLTGESRYADLAERTVKLFAAQIVEQPYASEDLLIVAMALMDAGRWETANAEPPDATIGRRPVRIDLHAPDQHLGAGKTATVRLRLRIDPPYHIYGPQIGDAPVQPTRIVLAEHEHIALGPIDWPTPATMYDPIVDGELPVYHGEVTVDVPLRIAPGASGELTAELTVHTQPCDDTACLAPRADVLRVDLAVAE